jgi:hypothetical protein
LDKYVHDGGKLYISTGWQYIDKDWQSNNLPSFFPVNSVSWSSDLPADSNIVKAEQTLITDVDTANLSSLVWAGKTWGVSQGLGVRDWAQTLYTANGKPLIAAGNYGQGKVVWSGLNFPGHITAYEYNKEEIKLFNKLLLWLVAADDTNIQTDLTDVNIFRNYPDKVSFTFNDAVASSSNFYWRESFFPDWHAYFISGSERKSIPILQAGPGFMFMHLPMVKKGDRLVLEFSPGLRMIFYITLSVIVFSALVIYALFGNTLLKKITHPFMRTGGKSLHLGKKTVSNFWGKREEEEEKY